MQTEITTPGPLLDQQGNLTQVGWSRQPFLDCNLEQANFYAGLKHPLQFLRLKRWDYYAIFTPRRFFSATIADLGYAGNLFVYTLDFETKELHEEGLVIPLSKGVSLPRNSQEGVSSFEGKGLKLEFSAGKGERTVKVDWPAFHEGRGIQADIRLYCPPEHESMTIVIPIEKKRFYYNRKINSMPAEGRLVYAGEEEILQPATSCGSLDWGRGVWAYKSFWNWASASGFLPDGRAVGLKSRMWFWGYLGGQRRLPGIGWSCAQAGPGAIYLRPPGLFQALEIRRQPGTTGSGFCTLQRAGCPDGHENHLQRSTPDVRALFWSGGSG